MKNGQRKKRNFKSIKASDKGKRLLEIHDSHNYYSDMVAVSKLGIRDENTVRWIEDTMHELRMKSNIYEQRMGEFLIRNNIKFMHQAPFVFYPQKIYFADYYLPKHKAIIEVDGEYHRSVIQIAKDKERDSCFKDAGIRVIRISNEELFDSVIEHLWPRLYLALKFGAKSIV